MTVAELIEALKEKDANAKVYIGVDGKKYDADAVQYISRYIWDIVGSDIVIVNR